MRSTKLISISLPPELLEQTEHLAKEDDRTRSGICREALRRYIAERQKQKEAEASQ